MDKQTDIKCDVPQAVTDPTTEVMAMMTSYINKEKEKVKRRLNIPKSASEDGLLRKKHDIGFLCSLSKIYLGFPVAINQAFRLGQKGEHPRLLKISVAFESEKVSFFRNSVKLHDKKHPIEIQKIFFTPDLTPPATGTQ